MALSPAAERVEHLRTQVRFLEGVKERLGPSVLDGPAGGTAAKLVEWCDARIGDLHDRIEAELGDTVVIDQNRLIRWSRGEAEGGYFD